MAEKEMNALTFLGTSGARFVMIKQLRASGGIWVQCGGTSVLIDPGPGSLVRCCGHSPRLDPESLDAIILTHRHLDHCADINVMIEAMTEGGFKKKGVVFCPQEALSDDPVIFRYLRDFPERIEILQENREYSVKEFRFFTRARHRHPAETYGLVFSLGGTRIALVADTDYFPGLAQQYQADILILPVVFYDTRQDIEHLSLPEAKEVIRQIGPRKVIFTHFGMSMLSHDPAALAGQASLETGVEVVAPEDGMTVVFP
jgi:ribonuclease BN (tRNA processing enzyme)